MHRNGIILAGGRSSRMGSTKGLLDLKGEPFISHCIQALQPWVRNLLIISDDPVYDQFPGTRINDIIKDSGPLGGLYAGLSETDATYNIVLSCDVPFINSTVLSILVNAIEKDFDVIQVQCEERSHPLIAVYQKACATHFKEALLSGERRLRVALESLRVKTIILNPDLAPYLRNINTRNEYKTLTNEIEH
jgi:molybdopterin-guanine dinucleotide biosynthesis protein A